MKQVLIDTSVLIDFLRRKNKETSFLVKILKQNHSPAISIITYAEVFAGKSAWQKKQARKELDELLKGMETFCLNREVAQLAGKLRAKYKINLLDAFIAAEAIISNLPLATLNIKDFNKIKKIKLFKKNIDR